jgi:hypothetical protein
MVAFTNGDTRWLPLKVVKESDPEELAEYAVINRIEKELAFKWVPYTLRKQDRIKKKVKTKYRRMTHKFSIWLPKMLRCIAN